MKKEDYLFEDELLAIRSLVATAEMALLSRLVNGDTAPKIAGTLRMAREKLDDFTDYVSPLLMAKKAD